MRTGFARELLFSLTRSCRYRNYIKELLTTGKHNTMLGGSASSREDSELTLSRLPTVRTLDPPKPHIVVHHIQKKSTACARDELSGASQSSLTLSDFQSHTKACESSLTLSDFESHTKACGESTSSSSTVEIDL